MKTKITKQGETTVISLDGRFDTASTKEFDDTIQPILGTERMNVLIDCEKLVYICSSGLRGFMTLLKDVTKNKGTLVIKGLHPEIKEIFDMTGFSSLFTIKD